MSKLFMRRRQRRRRGPLPVLRRGGRMGRAGRQAGGRAGGQAGGGGGDLRFEPAGERPAEGFRPVTAMAGDVAGDGNLSLSDGERGPSQNSESYPPSDGREGGGRAEGEGV